MKSWIFPGKLLPPGSSHLQLSQNDALVFKVQTFSLLSIFSVSNVKQDTTRLEVFGSNSSLLFSQFGIFFRLLLLLFLVNFLIFLNLLIWLEIRIHLKPGNLIRLFYSTYKFYDTMQYSYLHKLPNVVCHLLKCHVMKCQVMTWNVMSCLQMSCREMSCKFYALK